MLLGGSGFSSRPGMSVFTLPRISLASHVMLPSRSGSPALQAFCGWYLHSHHHRGRIALENAKLLNVNMQKLMSHRALRVGQLTHFDAFCKYFEVLCQHFSKYGHLSDAVLPLENLW